MIDILEIRKKLGWSREKLASEMGVSYFTIQNWELGQNHPSPLAENRIKDILKKELPHGHQGPTGRS